MGNIKLTSDEKFLLNRLNQVAQKVQLGTLIDQKLSSAIDGCVQIDGSFLVDATHGDPAAVYGNTDADGNVIFVITGDTQDGGYKIALDSAYADVYDIYSVTGSVGKGVAYNGGSPDLSGNGPAAKLDAPCINSETGEAFIVTQDIDSPCAPAHFAGVVVTFTMKLKPE